MEKSNRFLEKVSKANQKEPKKLSFKIIYEDKEIFCQDMDLKNFAAEALEQSEVSLYYECKDFVNKIENILAEKHKSMVLSKKDKEAN